MQGGDGLVSQPLEEGKVNEVDVEVDDVELMLSEVHLLQHAQMGGEIRLEGVRVEPDSLITNRNEPRARLRLRAGEERHIVAELDQCIGEMSHDPLGAAVETGRHSLIEGSHLGDLHSTGSLTFAALGAPDRLQIGTGTACDTQGPSPGDAVLCDLVSTSLSACAGEQGGGRCGDSYCTTIGSAAFAAAGPLRGTSRFASSSAQSPAASRSSRLSEGLVEVP